ncbi:thioredoxin [Candidatus Roizmanbacteria bacterium RIFCSPLOWO2_02_FULL_37_19]|uniref:Thioredoxin n=1 Tax=Candidatus Roizmanbacteria bacterium RIFCSPHIGHO2_02_FULL_37_24 TaxID=1802037 RepID=A0A1F7GWG3_9BACT|nr:MAG: thioredoxin [Candidatus Roizmanbacteria bacterium RIFCSPHIGHO2_01_FULL_38_41]OGK23261.1 MAG: thioredoxin [Candidatus Roizmanbacteria bacterium RIFCSPHIGHO2_02_FULL_37_24]OGK32546.1 MAG: thioredoxin [Candidatus Roizmanbacteria bacterium RIFCSPHIGHO2_12_FULL_37_23]OGK44221.1 MAG: thioredoxin [Candidatus Roizmanbacteria bacterium RIFCSPLOWO2_01_FULL_37_57]OGK54526.1 MAG: thioredoxin [Candidatus Roizmanbacteria bacterium RIFCSPLOWO2_02_FULL_37_19]OGK60334.1 MAG: thioredoxin [Candidatus Roi
MSVVQTNQGTFQNDVLDHKGLVFVDFYADWCGPCKVTSPLIEELATSGAYKDKIKFVEIDVDENQELAGKYNVFSIPTFIIFKDGEPVNQFVGARDKTGFEDELKKVLV